MSKYLYLLFFAVLMVSCIKNVKQESSTATGENNKPNIIIILVDDAGYIDFGFMGSKDLETPHIDTLAKNGVTFTDAHVTSTVCAPSRAGLMTGKYQQRFGFEANGTGDKNTGDVGLSEGVTTMADVFKEHDYSTVAIGKWHLGANPSDQPNQRGFEDFYGFLGGGRSYFPLEQPSEEHMLQHNGKRISFDGYLTDVLGDYSVNYIKDHKDTPFFMYLAYNAVHTPMEAKKVDLEKFKDHPRQTLAAMTWSLDENIGKLYNKLKDLKLLDNTLIYFLSDNGGAANNRSDNGELKGWKGNEFEGGHRVPFIVSWPKAFKGNRKFNGLSSSLDIFPTALAAAEIKKDSSMILDGVNLLPFLKNQKEGNPHRELYWRKLDDAAARLDDLKLIRLDNYGAVMYNLSDDIGETHDLSYQDSVSFNLLKNNLQTWESQMEAPKWDEGKAWMDVTYHIHKQLMQNKKVKYKSPREKHE
ncbi:sulfatase-like hydrolase/transferase [Gaetbulibacter sp. M240]|uniref:sulfatase-like hydrolase/transferase n=1 Tax=Gaetbulibacter sp. M240 TaxID=3126511 RepID=UPI00374FBDE4